MLPQLGYKAGRGLKKRFKARSADASMKWFSTCTTNAKLGSYTLKAEGQCDTLKTHENQCVACDKI